MKKINSILLVALSILSCNGISSIENNIKTKNIDYKKEDIFGKWKMDTFTYEYLSKKEKIDSIYLSLNKDNTFTLNNSKDLFNGKLDNILTKGTWEIRENGNSKSFELSFNNKSKQSGINIYQKGEEYQIWYFLSDPDSGERIRFLKQ
jgi:hypothetical protein